MGGKLVGAERMTPDTYHEVSENLLEALAPLAKKMKMSIPNHYRHKDSFGDIDIIAIDDKSLYAQLRQKLIELKVESFFESDGTNDPNFSIKFRGVQVDFMFFPDATIDFALRHLSYNSLGMVIGITARHAGFKLSSNGLVLPVYNPNNNAELITSLAVTTDFDRVLTFLDFDPNHHQRGFDTMEEMHAFIAKSRYFSRDFFSDEQLNSNHRRNLRQNRMYVSVKAYLKSRPETLRKMPTKKDSLLRALEYFPDLKERYEKAIKESSRKLSREDQKLMFASVFVPYNERKDFLKEIMPLVLNQSDFESLTRDEKIIWFKSAYLQVRKVQEIK